MRKLIKQHLALIGLLLGFQLVYAEIDIVITEGMNFARPVAVVPFQWQGSGAQPPHDVAAIIAADLRRSGRFNPIAYNEMPEVEILLLKGI